MSHVDARTRELQAPSTAAVLKCSENPKQDIINERKRASFDSNDLLHFLCGGKDKVDRRCVPPCTAGAARCIACHAKRADGIACARGARPPPCSPPLCRAQFAAMLQRTSWGDKSRRYFLSREEEYTEALRAALGIW